MLGAVDRGTRVAVLTLLAMLAFASNSILCRMALRPVTGEASIDPAGFTALRLVAGALMLGPVVWRARRSTITGTGSWRSALALFVYATAFSFAYVRLQTAIGALVLFGMVQVTMLGLGFVRGQRLTVRQWQGLVLSSAGLLGFTLRDDVRAPDPLGLALMAIAGAAWGVYSLRGRGVANPAAATAGNFLRSVPLVLILAWMCRDALHASPRGLALAVASGALASGLGYVLWYAALRSLSGAQAALVQLCVPVLAAVGGALLLSEPLTLRVLVTGAVIVAGIGLATLAPRPAHG
jgi:drug/metabolite transporter (DMT)-like permease